MEDPVALAVADEPLPPAVAVALVAPVAVALALPVFVVLADPVPVLEAEEEEDVNEIVTEAEERQVAE